MFLDEYDYETDIAVKKEEAKEEGFAEGIQQKAMEDAIAMLKKRYPLSDILEITGLTKEKVLELQEQIIEKA